jgi:hypothetical protein
MKELLKNPWLKVGVSGTSHKGFLRSTLGFDSNRIAYCAKYILKHSVEEHVNQLIRSNHLTGS